MRGTDNKALVDALLAVGGDLELGTVLQRIVESACALIGARYGALGVIGADGEERTLAEFVYTGIDDDTAARIGHLPEGHGILGLLVREPRTLRLSDLSEHPASYGFPPNHPPMRSFLGSPVRVAGEVFGNIYLTEPQDGGEFTEEHEDLVEALALAAGVAVQNARLYDQLARRERWLEAAREITSALLTGADPGEVLQEVARRARELVEADTATISLPDRSGRELLLEVADGLHAEDLRGRRYQLEGSISGDVLRSKAPAVFADVSHDGRWQQPIVAMGDLGPAIFLPLVAGDRAIGTLVVANRVGRPPLDDDDLRTLQSFAAQAAVALEFGRAQTALGRLALVEDRERIGRDLHDSVIQRLFATALSLQALVRLVEPVEGAPERVQEAVGELDATIRDIRSTIFALQAERSGTGGVRERILAVAADASRALGFRPHVSFDGIIDANVDDAVAENLVLILREALTNVARHARARSVAVTIAVAEDVRLGVTDDGAGFDPTLTPPGEGLRNMRERARQVGGEVEIDSAPGRGTVIRWRAPLPKGL